MDTKDISIEFCESKLKERNRELFILLEMSNLLSSSKNLKYLLSRALSKVLEYFDMEAGRIYLMDDEGQNLNLIVHQGMEPRGLEQVHIDEGFSGKSARTKSFIAQHVSDLEDKERAAFLLGKGFRIIICVPLILMDKAKGVMNLATSKNIKLDQKEIAFLTAIGNQIAIAVNNTQLYEELENKIQTLKEKKEMIKFFAYSISHDLKSPAISIHGLTKRLQERYGKAMDEKGRAYCEQILQTTEQLVDLVGDINAYIRARDVPLSFARVKAKEITETIRNEFSVILEQRKIKWLEPDTLPEIIADRMSLSRAFRNLVDNALKYGGKGLHEIKIGYEENEAYHILWVNDDGIGIREGDEQKIFNIFQRNETSKGTSGSGLGLAIVKEIAQRHKGQAWVERNSEKETIFYFSISKELSAAQPA